MVGSTRKGIAAPDPHKHFMKDFEVFLEEHFNKHKEFILGIDVNEEDSPAAEIQQLACQLDLIDAQQPLCGTKRAPATYKRDHHQLDFLLIKAGILPLLMAAGFLPYNILFISNPCTIYTDFDTDLLFHGVYNNPMDQNHRGLLSDNPKQGKKCVELLSNYFQTQNIEEQ
eukprot:14298351-Ditylum_brightwellii.AAC.1